MKTNMAIIDQDGTIYNYDNILCVTMFQRENFNPFSGSQDIWVIEAESAAGKHMELATYGSYEKCLEEYKRYRNALREDYASFTFSQDKPERR